MKTTFAKKIIQKWWLILPSLLLVLGVFGFIFTPSFSSIQKQAIGSDRYLVSASGEVLQHHRVGFSKRRLAWLPLSSYSQNLITALIFVEDKRFYNHPGVDGIALGRAAWSVTQRGPRQGGSTITMQLTNLIHPDVLLFDKRIQRGGVIYKLKQIFKALMIELKWSKPEILEAYLNLIHLKGETQGFQTFTASYWQKSPAHLNLTEGLILANLIRAPNKKIADIELRVCEQGKKINENYNCADFSHYQKVQKAPLHSELNEAPHLLRKLVRMGAPNSHVKSFIDPQLQKEVHGILQKNLSHLQNNNVHDISAVVLENATGRVVAYVGSIEDFSEAKDVDGADSPRQVGSTLKPFFYGQAIEEKILTASSIIDDDPTAISWAGGLYRPVNYDKKFHGPVTVRDALASSLNVPAVKVIKMLSLRDSYNVIQKLGFSDLKAPDFYGASIALGAVGVRLHELTNAYRALANGGVLSPVQWSPDLPQNESSQNILSPETAFILGSILSDPNARRMGFGWDSALETSFWTAVKTGTSKDLRDNWCIGYSRLYTVGVWAGNFSAERMNKVSGVTGAAPSWSDIMFYLHKNKESRPPEPPQKIVSKAIRLEQKAGQQTEYYIAGTEPLTEVVESSPRRGVSFTFPIHGTTLVRDPHRSHLNQDLFVRYKGVAPKGSVLILDGKQLGPLTNPFKAMNVATGHHHMEIKDSQGSLLAEVRFLLK
jgi:penicillin-binding protein 1C